MHVAKPAPASDEKIARDALLALMKTIQRLVGPNGCIEDRLVAPEAYLKYIQDEITELLEAWGTPEQPKEMGDVVICALSLVVKTNPTALIEANAKLLRRHPHVFGDPKGLFGDFLPVQSAEDAQLVWAHAKKCEKEGLL